MLVRSQNTERFIAALVDLNREIEIHGKLNLPSLAVHAEDFYVRLLNLLYGLHLVNANELDHNATAIDLIDEEAKVVVQVTADCSAAKVNETFVPKEASGAGGSRQARKTRAEQVRAYAEAGYRIRFVFVGRQWDNIKQSTAIREPYTGLQFDRKQDLLLTKDLAERFTHRDVDLQREILTLVDKETGTFVYSPDAVDAKTIATFKAHLISRKKDHPSFKLLAETSAALLPKGVIPNSERTVVPEGGDPVRFGDFIRSSWRSGSQCHLLITGEGGVGKTVALLSLATEDDFLPRGVAAVYIPLHELAQHCGKAMGADADCVDRFLASDFSGKEGAVVDARLLAERPWAKGPSLILLLDAYNEIPNDRRSAVDAGVAKWARWPGVQVVTTSRELALCGIRHMRRLKLEPLSTEVARTYLKKCGIERIPEPNDKIWQVVRTPLMLRLYVDSASFDGADAGYVSLEEPDCAGHLVWNYLQRELVRCVKNRGKYEPVEYAAAILLTLPYVCWRMEAGFDFTIEKAQLRETIEGACAYWAGRSLPEAFANVEGDELGYLEDLGNLASRRNADRQLAILEKETALLTARRIEDTDKKTNLVYSLMHQNFRDCLAALHVRNAIEADSSTVPEELRSPLSPFVKGHLAELADGEVLDAAWKANRGTQPTNGTTTHNLLGTFDRKNEGNLTALDWSGMDLSRISLTGYRRGSQLYISHEAEQFDGTRLGVGSLLPQGHRGAVSSVCFSPDGRLLASGSGDGTVRLWDASTGEPAMPALEGRGGGVESVCFSPDGRLLASGSDDGAVRLWDASTGAPAMPALEGRGGGVSSVCFSPDGRLLASGSHDGSVRLWDASTGGPIRTITPVYGIDLFDMDFSWADVADDDKETLRQNGVKFDTPRKPRGGH